MASTHGKINTYYSNASMKKIMKNTSSGIVLSQGGYLQKKSRPIFIIIVPPTFSKYLNTFSISANGCYYAWKAGPIITEFEV